MSNILFLDHYKTSMVDAMKRRYIEATLDYLGVKELESNSDFNTPKDSLNTAGYVVIGKILDGYTADEALKELSSNKALKDRKSTRLNSSHVAISYAVFC